jgi:hypothetical protein
MKKFFPLFVLATLPLAGSEVSGVNWIWRTDPTQTLESLEPGFRAKVEALMKACEDGGRPLKIPPLAGRPPERHYLMFWAWQIGREGYRRRDNPKPPAFPGMDIDWFWSHPQASDDTRYAEAFLVPYYVGAALQMVDTFGLARQPKKTCKLAEGKACGLEWQSGTSQDAVIKGPDGTGFHFHANRQEPEVLDALAASYGLHPVAAKDSDLKPEFFHRYFSDDGTWD